MIISFRDFDRAFERLQIPHDNPVIVHVERNAFDEIQGEEEAILGALFANYKRILMPAFTYQTMLTPRTGPANNGINYQDPLDISHSPEFFNNDMPVSHEVGDIEAMFCEHESTTRSRHPVLSFSALNLPTTLTQQTLNDPFAPITYLENKNAWVLLVGADQTKNIALHIAAKRANLPQFTRWALTPTGVKQFKNYPSCSAGYETIRSHLNIIAKRQRIGEEFVLAYPLKKMLELAQEHMEQHPLSLLCDQADCLRCQDVRKHVREHHPNYQNE